jgi:hypothetical protein
MAGPWLYSISPNGDFEIDGTKFQGTLANYTELLLTDKLSLDSRWYIQQNCRNVEINDEVFIYSGEAGIVGIATVKTIDPEAQFIEPNFDSAKCRELLRNPVPADIIKAWPLNPRKNNLTNLGPIAAELQALLPQTWLKQC